MFGMTVNPYVIQSTLMHDVKEQKIEFDEQRNDQQLVSSTSRDLLGRVLTDTITTSSNAKVHSYTISRIISEIENDKTGVFDDDHHQEYIYYKYANSWQDPDSVLPDNYLQFANSSFYRDLGMEGVTLPGTYEMKFEVAQLAANKTLRIFFGCTERPGDPSNQRQKPAQDPMAYKLIGLYNARPYQVGFCVPDEQWSGLRDTMSEGDTIAVLYINQELYEARAHNDSEYHELPRGIQYTETPGYLPTKDDLNDCEIGNWSKYFLTTAIQDAVFWTNQQLHGKENAKRSLSNGRSAPEPEVVHDDELAKALLQSPRWKG